MGYYPTSSPSQLTTHRSSPIHVPSRNGPLKDKAASDAEAENRKLALAPVKAALAKLGEELPRPDTAPSGPAEMDTETRRRSAQIMQDFFKETTLREKLQEQCDDLSREVENLQSEKERLKKQLVDAQAAIDAGGSTSAGTDLVNEMEIKFARETEELEEKRQIEATKAAELQQVLDDLNDELERQGQVWDAEKKKLVEQAAQIADLTKEVATLKDERDALSRELDTAKSTLEELQSKLADVEETKSEELRARNQELSELTKTVEEYRKQVESTEQRHKDALQEVQEALDTKTAESSALVEELQSEIESLQQQHTDELRSKDDIIASRTTAREELEKDLAQTKERADQATAEFESERSTLADELQKNIEELQKRAEDDLRAKEEEVTGHLKSIDGLQEQITKLQQGETEGVNVAQELQQQIEQLTQAHEAALKIKTDENDELLRQLDAINEQLSGDATELERLKDEAEGLHKTIATLEQVSSQESSQHASILAKLRAELKEATKKAESHKAELDATHEKHQQHMRTLGDDHDAEIESLRADLEGDAKRQLSELQSKYDSLVAEKNAALEEHEKASGDRARELETLKKELEDMQSNSSNAKHVKEALDEALNASQERVVELEARIEQTKDEFSATLMAATEARKEAEEAHAKSQSIITDLQARHDALLEDKTSAEDAHSRAIDALKQDSNGKSSQIMSELQSKYDKLLEEKAAVEDAHGMSQSIVADLQARHDALLEEKTAAEDGHSRAIDALKQDSESSSKQLLGDMEAKLSALEVKEQATEEAHVKALEGQRAEIEQKFGSLLEALQAELSKNEQERTAADAAEQSALNELMAYKKKAHAEMDAMRNESSSKEQIGSSSLRELTSKYEALVAEKATADDDHEAAIRLLKDELAEQHERAFSTLQSKHDSLQKKLSHIDQEHSDAIEFLREEFKEGHSNDMREQLEALQNQHKDLLEQNASTDHAHELAITELMAGMESSQSEAVQQLQKKYDALKARLEAAEASHAAELESIKQGDTEQQTMYQDLRSHHDTASQDVERLRKTLEATKAERDDAIKAAEDAEDRIETMKSEVVRKHLARVEPLEKENEALNDKISRLEAIVAAGDRVARVAATLGETRAINTLAEEGEGDSDASAGAQVPLINGNAPAKDVVATVS